VKLSAEPPPQTGIGVIAPYDFALDREIWRWLPDSASLFLTRTPRLTVPVTVEMARRVSESAMVRQSTMDILTPEPAVVCYLCTSGSFVRGLAGEADLRHDMLISGAPQALTTSGALLLALAALGIRQLAVATPYIASVTALLHTFLAESGVQVVAGHHLGLSDHIWQVPYGETADLVRAADQPEAEAIFLSCTNLASFDIIAPLERELGKPVLSANQVTMWAALRALGLRPPDIDQYLFRN
jgi:maleate isomerase